jgi:OmpA-OmpF porin, OOP family
MKNLVTTSLLGTAAVVLALSGCNTASKTVAAPAAPAPVAATPPAKVPAAAAAAVVMAPKPVVIGDVNFDLNKATLTPGAEKTLNEMTNMLLKDPETKYEINGYTDNSGAAAYNEGLSMRRAEAVRNYQVSRGVSPSQLVVRGYGESNPVASNATRDGRAMNRRVEIRPAN